jgi:hypothetical protein
VDRQLSSQFKVILHNQVDLLALVTFHDGSVGDGQARTDQLLDQLDPRGFVPDRHHARSVSSNWLFIGIIEGSARSRVMGAVDRALQEARDCTEA